MKVEMQQYGIDELPGLSHRKYFKISILFYLQY